MHDKNNDFKHIKIQIIFTKIDPQKVTNINLILEVNIFNMYTIAGFI